MRSNVVWAAVFLALVFICAFLYVSSRRVTARNLKVKENHLQRRRSGFHVAIHSIDKSSLLTF